MYLLRTENPVRTESTTQQGIVCDQGDGGGAAPDHLGGKQGGHGEEQEGEGQPRQGARHPLQHQVH